MTMQPNPSRWLWLTPLSVSVLAGWLMLDGIAAEPVPPAPAQSATSGSAYPAPQIDPSTPAQEPAPTF